jgi:hypothetical protein
MEQTLEQASKSSALVEQNKTAARQHLLSIQLLLSSRPIRASK